MGEFHDTRPLVNEIGEALRVGGLHRGAATRAARAIFALFRDGAGPVWCVACEGSGRQILSVGGNRCASDHPCQQCAGLGKHLPR